MTILLIGDLLSAHMFIGMALIPPVLLKLAAHSSAVNELTTASALMELRMMTGVVVHAIRIGERGSTDAHAEVKFEQGLRRRLNVNALRRSL